MTDVALTLLKVFEGFEPRVYPDAAGHATVGWGHKLLPGEAASYVGREVTRREAELLLISDFGKHRAGVLELTAGRDLDEHELEALTSFAFNLGENALAGSTLLKRVRASDRRGAAEEFPRWRKARDPKTGALRDLPGLVRRRHVEACWFLGASMPTLFYVLGDQAA